jgi:hypothetical protein
MATHGENSSVVTSAGVQTLSSGASQVVFAAGARNFLLIQNLHAINALYIGIGFTPTAGGGIWLKGGGGPESTLKLDGNDIPSSAINAIGTSGSTFVAIQA